MTWYDIVWLGWIGLFLVLEFFGLDEQGKIKGVEPLTTFIRDKGMKRHWPVALAGLIFWSWMAYHFFGWLA